MTKNEEKRIMKMAEEAIDHEARKVLEGLERRQDHLEKSIEEMKASNELFKTETRAALQDISARQIANTEKIVDKLDTVATGLNNKVEASALRLHTRIDGWIKLALIGTVGLIIALGAYVWKTTVG